MSNLRCDLGSHPDCEKWEIEEVGSIRVGEMEYDGIAVQTIDFPGWRMRCDEVYLDTGPRGYAAGPNMVEELRIGGWTVAELQTKAAQPR